MSEAAQPLSQEIAAENAAATQKLPSIFRNAAFRTMWMAQLVSIFGDFLALFAVISLITFRWHGTPVQVTTMTIAYIGPLAVLGPFAGVLVDHWNVKRVMIASDCTRAVLILGLLFAHDVRQVAAILFTVSLFSSFFSPAQSITVRVVVPMERLLHANAALSQAFYIIRIVSPLIAGAVIAWLGERVCFYVDAASFAFSALMISTLTIDRPPRQDADKSARGLMRDFAEGNRFIFTHAGLSFVFIAMAAAMFVLSSFSPLISIFVRDVLHAGTFLFGVVSAMVGVGLIAGTTALMRMAGKRPHPGIVLFGLIALAVATAVLGLSTHAWLAAFAMFLIGVAIALVLVPSQTMSQQETPPQMVGRVSSTFMSMIFIAQMLGLVVSGALAERLGMRPLFLWAALPLLLLAALGWWWMRARVTSGVSG